MAPEATAAAAAATGCADAVVGVDAGVVAAPSASRTSLIDDANDDGLDACLELLARSESD